MKWDILNKINPIKTIQEKRKAEEERRRAEEEARRKAEEARLAAERKKKKHIVIGSIAGGVALVLIFVVGIINEIQKLHLNFQHIQL